MADSIGVARRHFQKDATVPHYDICKAKRALAVQRGAVEIGQRQVVQFIRCHREASRS